MDVIQHLTHPDTVYDIGLACWETIGMVIASGFIATVVGLPLGLLMFVTRRGGLSTHPVLYKLLSFVVNVLRSVPFIILMVAVIPFTELIVGTSIGTAAAIVPLGIAAFPFVARVVENALEEVPAGLIEAAQSMGATNQQIVWRVYLPEAWSSIVNGLTLMMITLIGYSAMAGAVGGGGLGDLAIRYGYQRFDVAVMVVTVVILIVLVQLTQWAGDKLAKALRGC